MIPGTVKGLNQQGRAIYDLTLKLMEITSITDTTGVTEIGDFIYNYLQELKYFQEHPDYLRIVPLPDDKLKRKSIIAFVKGKKGNSPDTVVYLSHMDTVGIDDYGELKEWSCEPEKLMDCLVKQGLEGVPGEDLKSGNWLFGRGTADMKTGIAVELILLKEFSEKVTDLKGNILLVITVNEEGDSRGMLTVANSLVEFARKEELNLLGGINTDYTTECSDQQIEPDSINKRYIYTGSLGKAVQAVYIVGRPSHVGQVFQGFDVNLFLSNLTLRIGNNVDLADRFKGMITNPPVSLKQMDLKKDYNAQLPYEGFAYYNFMNFKKTTKELISLFKREVEVSLKEAFDKVNREHRKYCQLIGEEGNYLLCKPRVYTYSELMDIVRQKIADELIDEILEKRLTKSQKESRDLRVHSLELVRTLWELSGKEGPAAVVFLVPPYYPPQNPETGEQRFTNFFQELSKGINKIKNIHGYKIGIYPFFPYLSDASFCSYQEGKYSEKNLVENMPCWGKGWQIDINGIRQLNLPVANIGVYGKDAHKAMERVEVTYSMQTLPQIIKQITVELMDN